MEQPTRSVGARFPKPLYERLVKVAQQERRTRSNMIVVLVEEALRNRRQAQEA